LFTFELAERLRNQGVTVNCLHPGVINTKLLRVNFSGGSPVTEGAGKLLYLAVAPEPAGTDRGLFQQQPADTACRDCLRPGDPAKALGFERKIMRDGSGGRAGPVIAPRPAHRCFSGFIAVCGWLQLFSFGTAKEQGVDSGGYPKFNRWAPGI